MFYNLHISIGYDKVNQRTLELKWEKGEIFTFIVSRLLQNKFICENYENYLNQLILKQINNKRTLFHFPIFSYKKKKEYKTFLQRVSDDFLYLFFPQTINHINQDGELEQINFLEWLISHFEDQNKFINLRMIIQFFNTLFLNQYNDYTIDRPDIMISKNNIGKATSQSGKLNLNIFTEEMILKTYNEVQKDSVINIMCLLKDNNWKECFKVVHNVLARSKKYNQGSIQFKKFDMEKRDLDSLIEYLKIIGYLRIDENRNLKIPIVYQYKVDMI